MLPVVLFDALIAVVDSCCINAADQIHYNLLLRIIAYLTLDRASNQTRRFFSRACVVSVLSAESRWCTLDPGPMRFSL